ncbi:MAG TPA: FAD-binding and (Fe-S)-binding domain-containing protein [Candidatus Acidoferrales bacterium]|nr:FAD-binding and (Fe-S)-binding domain-containing protein [Candidatus Acidoferrales bacterium]
MAIATPTYVQPGSKPSYTPEQVKTFLSGIIPHERVLIRPIDLIAFASDASFYRLIPKAVVQASSAREVEQLFEFSKKHGIPMTFRAAGTSLSGQSISDGLLVEVARNFRGLEVLEGGRQIRLQPGVIGNDANKVLVPYAAKIGPDPASITTCTIGGILANNASGMCCGVDQNAYHTLASVRFVLPSGTTIDTADKDADQQFHAREPELAKGLLELKSRIEGDAALAERIRNKYRWKNTTGYGLNAFLDFDRAVDIFAHLLIGSEGTLAFIAEAVLDTVPDLPLKYTGLLLFPDLYAASASIVPLRSAGAKALEIMDRASLRSVENQPGIDPVIRQLPGDAAGLLAEFQAGADHARAELEEQAASGTSALQLYMPARFTHSAVEQAALWKIRSGMFPSVGSVRKSGTTVIIEDVAFPIEQLAPAAKDLTALFGKHGYSEGIIFGHAKDGNLHFVVTQGFGNQKAIDQYERFIDDVVKLVVDRYDGALKAEHGTGRNMAPFVQTEWGPEAYEIMRSVKALCDPANLLNPGVIINPNPRAHLTDLKQLPTVEPEIDKCIECGFCEPKCPSRDLTTTPRQRIVVRREMARQLQSGPNTELLQLLERDFPYAALDTCAADGLCATACPVSIDTGKLVKRFRALRNSDFAKQIAWITFEQFKLVEGAIRIGLGVAHVAEKVIGLSAMQAITRAMRKVIGPNMPVWNADMPYPTRGGIPETRRGTAQAVYFPACISRAMGKLPGETSEMNLMQATVAVAERAGVPVWIPEDVAGTCCATPYSSKGFEEARDAMLNRAIENFWRWSDEGHLPIMVDTSPCTYGLQHARDFITPANQQRFDKLQFIDSVEFVHDHMLPNLNIKRQDAAVALHPVCSLVKMGLTPKLEAIARKCSGEVLVPKSAGCCAFAGDRGFMYPELTESATKQESAEVRAHKHEGCYSSSRTCELGMTRATGQVYRSYMYLLEKLTRP